MTGVTVTIVRDASLVRTVRLVAAAVARRAGREEDFVEEVRLAVGEACGLLVAAPGAHDGTACGDRIGVRIELGDRFEVAVSAAESTSAELNLGYGPIEPWALLRGLIEDFTVTAEGPGTRLSMSWPLA